MGQDDYRRDSGDNISTRLTYLLIGGGIGAILALLFAATSRTPPERASIVRVRRPSSWAIAPASIMKRRVVARLSFIRRRRSESAMWPNRLAPQPHARVER